MAQLLAHLATRHDVALLALRDRGEPPVDVLLRDRCELVEEWTRPRGVRALARQIASAMRGRPSRLGGWEVAGLAGRIRSLARTWRPDLVQLEYHVMGQYVPALAGSAVPRVLTQHEPGARAARDRLTSCSGPARLAARVDVLAWERFERAMIAEVQAVVVFTEEDRQALLPLAASTPVVRIPLGATIPERPLNPAGRPPPSLLFVGSFIHPPNVDAADRLVRSIFPRVRARCPDLSLHIVGDRPPRRIRRMADGRVVVTGRVPDVAPYLDRAALFVAPLRQGAGMRVKVLEALAAGKAVIASPLAVEGLDVADGIEVVVAESDQEFSDAIVRLLANPGPRVSLGARARAWALANLSWERSTAAYEALYERLTAQPDAARSPR